ncbi:hypothetical protein CSUB01_10610 [Colletotrichum sublineola]|uniref:Serine hydrolase domain-containing protein n=1 Tax=Colletotrichum sublineola TaxID=1173701 RepID=A0A066XG39_COLSU|nr:hypothetical protein CSUB01_10610 [Colletotrichum sublineola]
MSETHKTNSHARALQKPSKALLCFHGTGSKGAIFNVQLAAVDRWSATKSNPACEIVGGIGFSEGALALSMLLWEQQQGAVPWLPRLHFAAMSCCFFPSEASLWLNARAHGFGLTKAHIDVPTLHTHGNRDFCLGRARKLVRTHYRPEYATVLQTEAGHHLPTKREEVAEVVKHILRLSTTAPPIAVA